MDAAPGAAAPTPPKQRQIAITISNNRHLPAEIIEQILLNLPQKSLIRFSTVSKLWKSTIFDPVFARKHKNHAALLRRHRLVVWHDKGASICSLAPISSDLSLNVTKNPHISPSVFSDVARYYVDQFEGKPCRLLAFCDELWFVEVQDCLYLLNPCMRNTVRLPHPSSFDESELKYDGSNFIFGLAYDSVNDDYKILKLRKEPPGDFSSPKNETELYSLKNGCWREIESFCEPSLCQRRCEFVDGKLHWTGFKTTKTIVSFDMSTEKYGEMALPQSYDHHIYYLEVVAFRGKLCAYRSEWSFVMWVMEEYGVAKSWTKSFDILYCDEITQRPPERMTPLYVFDNNDVLVKIHQYGCDYMFIFTYGNAEAKNVISGYQYLDEADAFPYVESLITITGCPNVRHLLP